MLGINVKILKRFNLVWIYLVLNVCFVLGNLCVVNSMFVCFCLFVCLFLKNLKLNVSVIFVILLILKCDVLYVFMLKFLKLVLLNCVLINLFFVMLILV